MKYQVIFRSPPWFWAILSQIMGGGVYCPYGWGLGDGYGYGNLMTHIFNKKGRLQVLLLWYYHNFYFLIFSVFVRRFVEFC